ncbi:PP2C family protein-serine/threonine phosphatase [Marinactinospora thermotolerans]|uniref:Stage II sporulation protein E (SpoIIE) n=1 Tax=Marinactinospora thermotolerans DSM 45154 TaxID=1122192 RepID=A0A1T4LXI6_9ACTN|nr:PP2C family protein-serine/threonine phosphatase [Marinactinospora thermotolerans]SJZ59377.1 Stage II sporulation protein E (SpoIIE) [Marinactinospora thermotolerans DSM 45154]
MATERTSERVGAMLAGLLSTAHLCPLDELPALIARHAPSAGLHDVVLYLADLRQEVLRPLTGTEIGLLGKRVNIDATLAGRAYRTYGIVAVTENGEGGEQGPRRLWVPLVDGVERLGVLRVGVEVDDAATREAARALADLVALLVASKRPHSDTYAGLVRSRPMSVSAEVQWTLMPPSTFANDDVVVSAALEPAYHIGGDAFDYALAGDLLRLAIFDATGHDLASGLAATIAMGCNRNQRRQGRGLVETSEAIDAEVGEQFGGTRSVTGLLADLDLRTGVLTWVNRGHHPPLVIRGGRWVAELSCPPALPMGMPLPSDPEACQTQLEPGDRLVLYTDGIIEARSSRGDFFGLHRFIDFIIRRMADGLSTPETLRRLVETVLRHQDGRLEDDATVLLVEWGTKGGRDLLF